MAEKQRLVFGGIPTKLDVDKILAMWPDLKAKDIIPYQDIETLCEIKRRTCRWSVVTNAWRRRLESERNMLLRAGDGQFEVLDNHGRVAMAGTTYKSALRKVGRSVVVAAKTDRTGLNPDEKRTVDHIQNTGAALRLSAMQEARRIKWDDEPEEAK